MVSLPQAQRQRHDGRRARSVLSTRSRTMRRPNTWPTRDGDGGRSWRACSTRRHPHDRVLPDRRDSPSTNASSPQVQRQRHNGRGARSVLSARARTVRRPNTRPTRSIALTGHHHRNHRSVGAGAVGRRRRQSKRRRRQQRQRRAATCVHHARARGPVADRVRRDLANVRGQLERLAAPELELAIADRDEGLEACGKRLRRCIELRAGDGRRPVDAGDHRAGDVHPRRPPLDGGLPPDHTSASCPPCCLAASAAQVPRSTA
jgi:hypothetical protein